MSWAVQHISMTINRKPDKVYAYAANPENLAAWAAGLRGSIRWAASSLEKVGETWVADSPMGLVKIRFAPHNSFGILDHDVTLPNGDVVHNPMRVMRNDTESEVIFTLFLRPGMSLEDMKTDASQVLEDLLNSSSPQSTSFTDRSRGGQGEPLNATKKLHINSKCREIKDFVNSDNWGKMC